MHERSTQWGRFFRLALLGIGIGAFVCPTLEAVRVGTGQKLVDGKATRSAPLDIRESGDPFATPDESWIDALCAALILGVVVSLPIAIVLAGVAVACHFPVWLGQLSTGLPAGAVAGVLAASINTGFLVRRELGEGNHTFKSYVISWQLVSPAADPVLLGLSGAAVAGFISLAIPPIWRIVKGA
ncbi:MAG: hypothetical protein AB7K24_24730 [Gemmataceae bacterium]